MKKLFILISILIIQGCASHANIEMPLLSKVESERFSGKTFTQKIYYSQPKPGVFSGGQEMPVTPIEKAELSVASANTLRKLNQYIQDQLPASTVTTNEGATDYNLVVELKAFNKKGPAYADYRAGKSFAKNMMTAGIAPSDYFLVADFEVNYKLYEKEELVFSKNYKVLDKENHQRGDFETNNSLFEYVGQLFEKHINITLNSFLRESVKK